VQALQWAGPIPPPQWLQGYEQIVPGSADRLIVLAEDEAVHRRGVERAEGFYKMLSLVFAFILAAVVLGAGIYFVATGRSVAGLTLLVVQVVALAGVLLTRKLSG
jgi:uncharacterized membrane protein